MLSVSPGQAVGFEGTNGDLIHSNLTKAGAEGHAHCSDKQKKARDRLDEDGAF